MAIRFNSVAEKFEGPVTLIVVSGVDNQKIVIPGIHEDIELMMFDDFTHFKAAAVALFLERKKAAWKFETPRGRADEELLLF